MPDDNVPQFKILVNGAQLPSDTEVDVVGVTVSQYVDGADVFTLELNNWDSNRQEFKWIDTNDFAPGVEVEIKMGYIDTSSSLIKGEITALEPEYPSDKAPTLKVTGYDRLHRFRRGRHTRSFVDVKDSDVAQQIARELKLRSQVDDSEITHPFLFQNNQSNIDFLCERARRIRFEVDVEDKTLIFRRAANNLGSTLTLAFGDNLKSFCPRLTTLQQVTEVVVQSWDMKNKAVISAKAKAGDETTKMQGSTSAAAVTASAFGSSSLLIADHVLASGAEADQMAKAQFNAISDVFVTGEATAIGSADIRAGQVVEFTKLGKLFSGLYYVTAAGHAIRRNGYLTHMTVQSNAI